MTKYGKLLQVDINCTISDLNAAHIQGPCVLTHLKKCNNIIINLQTNMNQ